MKVAFVYMKGRVERLEEVARGEAPTEFFYGAIELARAGIEVGHFEIDPAAGRGLFARGFDLLERLKLAPFKTNGRLVAQAAAHCQALNGYDLVVATTTNIGFALSLCAHAGRLRPKLLTIQCGLLNHRFNPLRQALMRQLLRSMHSMLFGESELAPMRQAFGLAEERISVNQFGVDTGFWTPPSDQPPDAQSVPFVLSVGNDGRRDFDTLLAAAPLIGGPIQIVTSRRLPGVLPANVTLRRGSWHTRALSDRELRTLYQTARCVVVPLIPSWQPSGQSVALQAMACGTPVVLTDTEGLWSRRMMVDGKNVLLCRPGDPVQLAATVRQIVENPTLAESLGRAGRETACVEANIGRFAEHLGGRLEALGRG